MPHVESVIFVYGLVVKRLRHRPFTAVSGVRVPSRSPKKLHFCSFSKQVRKASSFRLFFLFCDHTKIALHFPGSPKNTPLFLGKRNKQASDKCFDIHIETRN